MNKIKPGQELTYSITVREAMCKDVITVSPKIKIKTLRKILKERKISGAPVIEKQKLVGIISLEDLLKCLLEGKMDAKVEERMTRDVAFCYPDDTLIKVIQLFEKKGYGRLPVVEKDSGKVVGLITKGDVVLCLFKKLEELYEKVEENHQDERGTLFRDIPSEFNFKIEKEIKKLDFSLAGSVSNLFRDALMKIGIPLEYVRRSSICSYEAEMNMVIYSEGGKMSLDLNRDRILIKAIDKGPGIADLKKALTPGYSTAPDWIRELGFGAGMGLPNIKRNSDRFTIKSKVNEYTKLFIEVKVR
jgi:CBS domain-containing protein